MIDLTPLDIRKKRGDFGRGLRGYLPEEVDQFLELAADRLEELVRENLRLRERAERLGEQVEGLEAREKAVQEALVTAQSLRDEIKSQARREAELIRSEAERAARVAAEDAERAVHEMEHKAERLLHEKRLELHELDRARLRFLRGYRTLLERALDGVETEEASPSPMELEYEPQAGRESDVANAAGSRAATDEHERNRGGEG